MHWHTAHGIRTYDAAKHWTELVHAATECTGSSQKAISVTRLELEQDPGRCRCLGVVLGPVLQHVYWLVSKGDEITVATACGDIVAVFFVSGP